MTVSLAVIVFLVAYPFVLYPALLWVLTKLRPRPWKREKIHPSVSILIAAHNEENSIARKLENTLQFEYAGAEVIVVSDGSTDGTDRIVESFAPRVSLVRTGFRKGKQEALNQAVARAKGEILLFTDVGYLSPPDTLERLVRNFFDPRVGLASAIAVVHARAAAEATGDNGERAYMKWDSTLRIWESTAGSATGSLGTFYAVRRRCHRQFPATSANDFFAALDVVRQGYRVVFDRTCFAHSTSTTSYQSEFSRKVRTIVGGIDAFVRSGVLVWGWRNPLYTWFLWSHKVARWMTPPALLAAGGLIVYGALLGSAPFQIAAGALSAGIAIAGALLLFPNRLALGSPLRVLAFGLVSVAAGVYAWLEYFLGRRYVAWKPTQRPQLSPSPSSALPEDSRGAERARTRP